MMLTAGLVAALAANGGPSSPGGGRGSVHGCDPPFGSKPWCNTQLPLARRSELLVAELTLPELISQMSDGMPAIP
eukprot:SAG22_NODE_19678_length_272_cov_1.196532_1_plen_74_part_10